MKLMISNVTSPVFTPRAGRGRWSLALGFALALAGLLLGLFYYWFAIADRYAIFLYNHLGATPFDPVTSSRYWMAGLVAGGIVLALNTFAHWLLGRLMRGYTPPAWGQVWLLAALPLCAGIPLITMTCNRPTLPLSLALASLAAVLAGLALALPAGPLAARQPGRLVWLALNGAGLVPILLLLRVIELPARGLVVTSTALVVAAGSILAGAGWLLVLTWLGRRRWLWPTAGGLLLAGASLSYLLLPLVHYLLFVPAEWRYISTAANFFAVNPWVQLLAWMVAAGLAAGITRLRKKS